MLSKYRPELDVVLDPDNASSVINAARKRYAVEGAVATVDGNGAERTLTAEEFIDGIESALMELVASNPLLVNAEVKIERVTCGPTAAAVPGQPGVADSATDPGASVADEDAPDDREPEDDLEEFETGLYLCRWPNGDFSLVKADDRRDAVVQLDEWAGAEPARLVPVETCMIDFRLNDRGEIELAEFGEETAEFIWDHCYPELDEVLSSEDVSKHVSGKRKREAANKIRRAVEHERKRLWNSQGKRTPAKTALGRELQKRLGTVGPVADRYVEIAAYEILRMKTGEKGKPN